MSKFHNNTSQFGFNYLDDQCVAFFNIRTNIIFSTIMFLIKKVLLLIVIFLANYFFNKDTDEIINKPIKKMLKKIDYISKNPIDAILNEVKEDENENYLCCYKNDNTHHLETNILEKTISKISALLAIGFGEAGSEIIATNMKGEENIDPMIDGKKVMAIYGFCDIRNFTDTTEELQEDVMIFVNRIGEIVHEIVNECCGSANKNIGDAFLLVWKFDEEYVSKIKNNTNSKQKNDDNMNNNNQQEIVNNQKEKETISNDKDENSKIKKNDQEIENSNLEKDYLSSPYMDKKIKNLNDSLEEYKKMNDNLINTIDNNEYSNNDILNNDSKIIENKYRKYSKENNEDVKHNNSYFLPPTKNNEKSPFKEKEFKNFLKSSTITVGGSEKNKSIDKLDLKDISFVNKNLDSINIKRNSHFHNLNDLKSKRSESLQEIDLIEKKIETHKKESQIRFSKIMFPMQKQKTFVMNTSQNFNFVSKSKKKYEEKRLSLGAKKYNFSNRNSKYNRRSLVNQGKLKKKNNNLEEKLFLKKCDAVSSIVDMSLISFARIIIKVHTSKVLDYYRHHESLNKRLPNFSVKMGFGLHLGWSIEGAIGSNFKIDVTYLSPHVYKASKLEEYTKEYGVIMVLSDEYVNYLSNEAFQSIRCIDCFKDESNKNRKYYTLDLDTSELEIEKEINESNIDQMSKYLEKRKERKETLKLIKEGKVDWWTEFEKNQDFINSRKKYTKQFYEKYNLGLKNFQEGNFLKAKLNFLSAEHELNGMKNEELLISHKNEDELIEKIKDGPIKNFIEFMKEHKFIAPRNWDGYRIIEE